MISSEGFEKSYELYCKIIDALEANEVYRATCLGEPQLGKRGFYPTLSRKGSAADVRAMMNLLAYADGKNDLVAVSDITHTPVDELHAFALTLEKAGLLKKRSIFLK
jgi:aminopeptidase-like protein